ncbi:Na+/H+ antiporter subunit E [Roseomonas sp. OT10]|uniref:Na+/H+ antiporter subunit E n=1 Tax=Roseomonas cutis TaxID=2897332 RepID=UPI001E489C0C|nr:Na+/H+ antiporter subunit E [Roseomonas sp. OT10]UFN48573.1 Na+/H+ antiporter subunit E [Roseomonas sp. OT10]
MDSPAPVDAARVRRRRSALPWRATAFLAAWIVIAGAAPAELAVGLVTSCAAAWVSLFLLPPGLHRLHAPALVRYVLHVARQSVLGAVEVAGLALQPRPPLRPGFVVAPLDVHGGARAVFCAAASLVPGTLPVRAVPDGGILLHALRCDRPVLDGWRQDEALFRAAVADAGR